MASNWLNPGPVPESWQLRYGEGGKSGSLLQWTAVLCALQKLSMVGSIPEAGQGARCCKALFKKRRTFDTVIFINNKYFFLYEQIASSSANPWWDLETMSHSSRVLWLHSVACELCTNFPTHLPRAFHCLPLLYRGAHLITHSGKLGFIRDPPSISLRRTNQSPGSVISSVPPLRPTSSHPDAGVCCLSPELFPDSPRWSEYSLEGLMLKLKLQYFGHLMWRAHSLEKTLMLGKIEGRRRRGQRRMRWLNGIINSMDMEQTPGDDEGQGSLACCSP